MTAEGVTVEGDLDALEREIETGLAARGVVRLLWQFAEWGGPHPSGTATAHPEDLIDLEEDPCES